jgi:hypothetical protein
MESSGVQSFAAQFYFYIASHIKQKFCTSKLGEIPGLKAMNISDNVKCLYSLNDLETSGARDVFASRHPKRLHLQSLCGLAVGRFMFCFARDT